MKKNFLQRILGVIFSLVLLAGVFMPYTAISNLSLINAVSFNEKVLAVVLVAFGIITALLYVLNKYIEFALSTSGAVLFFTIIEAVYAINNNALNQFGLGYYMLLASSLLLIILTIFAVLSKKKNVKEEKVEAPVSVSQEIDNLYNEQNIQMDTAPVVEEIKPLEPISVTNDVAPLDAQHQMTMETLKPIEEPSYNSVPTQAAPEIQFEPIEEKVEPIKPLYEEPKNDMVNPVVSEFMEPTVNQQVVTPQEPVIINQGVVTQEPTLNPINQGVVVPTDSSTNPVLDEFKPASNPVLEQFDTPTSFLSSPVQQTQKIEDNQEPSIGMDIFNNH